jgi:cysteine peptidase B
MRLAVFIVAALIASAVAQPRTALDEKRMFEDFKMTYGRIYKSEEESKRFDCFRQTLAKIDERNAKGAEQHGVNQFTDLCAEEFARKYLGTRVNKTSAGLKQAARPAEGRKIDWREKGAVVPVQNQGQCGSCWAFTATINMAAQWFLKGHELTLLSTEEVIQCSGDEGNMGCNGGEPDWAFKWVIANGGIDSNADYPYTSGSGNTGDCKTDKLKKIVASFSSYFDLPHDEKAMGDWVYEHGPVSMAIDATTWQTYTGGIMSNCDTTEVDHGSTIVGYDDTNNPPYWIVQNMWGTSWGENGYIRLEKGTNQCGITTVPSSAVAA